MTSEEPTLERSLTFAHVAVAGIGMTIGAGVFAVLGVAAGQAGNAVWLSFLIAGFCAILTGLSYAELASMFPKAGAEFEYILNAFGKRAGIIIGCVVIVACIIGAAMIISTCAAYAALITGLSPQILRICIIPIFLYILLREVRNLARFVILLTIAEVGCLVLLVFVSLPYAGTHPALEMPMGFGGVLSAAAMVFIAFSGFEGIVKLSEETVEPEKVIPRGLLIALGFVTLLYAASAYCSIEVTGWETLSKSLTPVTLVFEQALNLNSAPAVSAIIVLGTANSAIMVLFAASRVMYGMAVEGIFPNAFSNLNPVRKVPVKAVFVVVLSVLPFTFLGTLASLADLTSFFFIISYFSINLGVMSLRIRDPHRLRPFRIPVSVRGIPVSSCLGLVVSFILILLLPPDSIIFGGVCLCIISGITVLFEKRSEKE